MQKSHPDSEVTNENLTHWIVVLPADKIRADGCSLHLVIYIFLKFIIIVIIICASW